MNDIALSENLYGLLYKFAGLVKITDDVKNKLLSEKRSHAITRFDEKINKLSAVIAKSNIGNPELSNRLLCPLQLLKEEVITETSVSGIYMLKKETADDEFHDGLFELEKEVQRLADEHERQAKELEKKKDELYQPNSKERLAVKEEPIPTPPKVAPPKAITEVNVSSIYNKT
jgi:hypothetical protein